MYCVSCVSACRGDGFWTSGVCVWVWGPPAASSERCGFNGRWKLHTPIWLHCWTCVFQLEVLESCAVPEDAKAQDTNQFKTQTPGGQLEYILQFQRTPPLFLLFWGIWSLKLSDSLLMNLRGHKGPQVFFTEKSTLFTETFSLHWVI